MADGAKLSFSMKSLSSDMFSGAEAEYLSPVVPTGLALLQELWFVAHTNANHEKRVAAHLNMRSIEHFLPLYSSLRRWKDRRVRLELPLFPGYVFVRIAQSAQLRALEIPGIARLVGFNGRPYPIPEGEIESLRRSVSNGLHVEPHPYLKAGCGVRVKRGPLQGAEGILVRKKNTYRIVLSLELISRSAAVEIDAADVERID